MNQERIYRVLIAPHVSEKSAMGGHQVFRVAPDATRLEVKRAVESLFDVKVKGVRLLSQKGKRKIFGRTPGRRADWKKAYVTLKEGQDIELSGAES
jgi:large subunit ribosomal protein L23